MSMNNDPRDRRVTAVLGPTNTGKTHLAIERMLAHKSGLIGLPLRLLAREVYDRIAARVGADQVALVTGEEKIKPEGARYWVSTVEAMPRDLDVAFLAIDEVQLAGDTERGHVFTDRLLQARGREETLLLGAQTMAGVIADLIPGANFITRPRLSQLNYAGQKKITRLPRRTAIVAFSAAEVYSVAELMRRQRGGAAVVLGGLSPRTRNAQVELYQSGDVDFLVATDAIGMGLNLDVGHVAFAGARKFDGERHRDLSPSELAQIAGRAGRHMNDGTFGVTGTVEPFDPELVEQLESHRFQPLKKLQWRNSKLDFSSLSALHETLAKMPGPARLMRARAADDQLALEAVSREEDITQMATSAAATEKLWDVCQIPDYRKISNQSHAELVGALYRHLMAPGGHLPEDWVARQVDQCDRDEGDIDTLSTRISHIRTWTFVSNRADWLKDPAHWQDRTRQIEDKLSDALHERLMQRFVDRKTSALMKGMRDKEELFAEVGADGAIHVEKHYVGKLQGFCFSPEDHGAGLDSKAARGAAAQVLGPELAMRARRVAAAKADAFKLSRDGKILWRDEVIATIAAGEDPLKPVATLICDEHIAASDKEKVQARIDRWLSETIAERLKPLVDLSADQEISGLARGIAFQLKESFGCLRREAVAEDIRALDQPSRGQLRRHGVRFGAFNIFFPLLLKPAAADLLLVLWTIKNGAEQGVTFDNMPEPPRPGLTSLPADLKLPSDYYRVTGFHLCGPRAVRADILERLADLIRPLLAFKAKDGSTDKPPEGATGDGGFTAIPDMMSILGCSGDELGDVLKALGFRSERREVKSIVKESAGTGIAAQVARAAIAAAIAASPQAEKTGSADAQTSGIETQDKEADQTAAAFEATDKPVAPAAPGEDREAKEAGSGKGDTPAAKTEAAGPAKAGPAVIEIWRPARRKHAPRRQRARGQDNARSRGDGGRDRNQDKHQDRNQDGRGGNKNEGSSHSRNNRQGNKSGSQGAGSGARAGASAGTGSTTGSGAAQRNDRGGGRDGEGRGKGGKSWRGKSAGRNDRSQGYRAKPSGSAAPKKRRVADPDSPFAALGSLKKELEKGGKSGAGAKDSKETKEKSS